MIVKLLTEHHLVFLSLKGACTGSSESTHVKMPHCWKSHDTAQIEVAALYQRGGGSITAARRLSLAKRPVERCYYNRRLSPAKILVNRCYQRKIRNLV